MIEFFDHIENSRSIKSSAQQVATQKRLYSYKTQTHTHGQRIAELSKINRSAWIERFAEKKPEAEAPIYATNACIICKVKRDE